MWTPGGVTGASLQSGNPTIGLTLTAQNTSSTDLLLNSFAGNLYSNGTLIGNVSNFSGQVVPANSATPIQLTVSLLPIGVVNDIFQAIQYSSSVQALELDGDVNVNSFQIPVKLNYSVG